MNYTLKNTNTAYADWNNRWKTEEGRQDWLIPEPFVKKSVSRLNQYNVRSILDLGCGVGRHALFLAQNGFYVSACDASTQGLAFLQKQIDQQGISMPIELCQMINLPYAIGSMDCVLAWNVIYHGDISVVHRTLGEVHRVLKIGGIFLGTMLSKRSSDLLTATKISYNTFINEGRSDKEHPHFYCSSLELVTLLSGFELIVLNDREHKRPGSYHWHFIAQKIV